MEGGRHMVAFEVAGGKAVAFRVANALTIIGISITSRRQEPHHPSGDDHSPAAQTRAARALGIAPGLLRLSVGFEDVEDRSRSLRQALDKGALLRHQAGIDQGGCAL
jgi:O-succinylhomoserine sulfhydrylase